MVRQNKAFTLIELLVVISIVALLSSVVLASLNTARERARIAALRSFSSQVDRVAGEQAVGIWDLDECTGSTAADRSGFGNNGALINGTLWSSDTPNSIGCSASFDGSNDGINLGSSSILKDVSLGSFTVSAWVKTTDTSSRGCLLCSYSGGATLAQFNFEIYNAGNGRMRYYHAGLTGSDDVQSLTGNLQDGKWHHVTMVRDKDAGQGLIYIDGILDRKFTYAATDGSVYSSNNFYIGTDNRLTADITHNGLIDGVRLFSKALTAFAVGDLYAGESAKVKYVYE